MDRIHQKFKQLQSKLNFEDWEEYPQFSSKSSIGRVALIASILSFFLGVHLLLWIQISLHFAQLLPLNEFATRLGGASRMQMLWQWSAYGSAICLFHLLEYFITAIYNPSVTTAESFLVNHSVSYTVAAITAWVEFAIRFCFFPNYYTSLPLISSYFALIMVVAAQIIRTLAMITARESFNHIIQTYKKSNHKLVTTGIYSVLRHPSYVGFFYWSIGTQLLLGNLLSAISFSIASWTFFSRRILFEEDSLCKLFPNEYPQYVARTWMGIPFLYTRVSFHIKQEVKSEYKKI